MFDFTRVVINSVVYLPVKEICQLLEISRTQFNRLTEGSIIKVGPGKAPLLSELDYNQLLFAHPELLTKNGGFEEITQVKSLRAEFNGQQAILPLKHMFFPNLNDALERQKDIEMARSTLKDFATRNNNYQESCRLLQNKEFINIERCREEKLDIQMFTEVNLSTGAVGLSVYLVGDGVFYNLFLDEGAEENWTTIKREDNGDYSLESLNSHYEFERKTLKKNHCNRDFRNYNVFDNIAWCLSNLPLNNEWRDELNVDSGTIYFNLNIALVTKMFNSKSFNDVQLIEGMIGVK